VVLDPNSKCLVNPVIATLALFAALTVNACGSESSTDDGGNTTNSDAYWGGAFSPPAVAPAVNFHAADTAGACMSCHGATGTATTKLVYGGVVYQADGVTPAPNVQVGVSDGTYKSVSYSAANGMYWGVGTASVNWPAADIRTRSATGESVKATTDARNADCDSCHHAGMPFPLKTP
jgi:cytochrome c553